jgi:amphi-Trp domain-containing protein
MASVNDFKHEQRLTRQQAAERLADIAYALTAGDTLQLRAKGEEVCVKVASEVLLTRETKSNGDRVEIEVGLSWHA